MKILFHFFFLQGVFFFSCIWSVGGALDSKGREKFNILFRGLLEKSFPENYKTLFDLPMDVLPPAKNYIFTIPAEGLVFDYRFIKEVSNIYALLKKKSNNN